MSWGVSYLADRKELVKLNKWESFIGRKEQDKEVTSQPWIVSGKVTFLLGKEGVYQDDNLAGVDQVIPDWLIKITFLGQTESAIRLGIKSQFDDVGLAQVTPYGACFLFLTKGTFYISMIFCLYI